MKLPYDVILPAVEFNVIDATVFINLFIYVVIYDSLEKNILSYLFTLPPGKVTMKQKDI